MTFVEEVGWEALEEGSSMVVAEEGTLMVEEEGPRERFRASRRYFFAS